MSDELEQVNLGKPDSVREERVYAYEPTHIVVVQTSGEVLETDDNYVEIKGTLLGTESAMFVDYDSAWKWLVHMLLEAHGGDEATSIMGTETELDDDEVWTRNGKQISISLSKKIEHFRTVEGPTHGYIIEL